MIRLVTEMLGGDGSVAPLVNRVCERAAGNPFFAEEIVRDLADRGVLQGERGAYTCADDAADVDVPATVHAAIAARIDRLAPDTKRALNAAAVVGLRFDADILGSLVEAVAIEPLLEAELIDQVTFADRAEYAFRHPLIRSVAYRSQLASARADLHRRLAAAVESRDPTSADENAALIAQHIEAAGELSAAFGWHMRAGEWLRFRDIKAARLSWQRAREVADRLPPDHPERQAMRIGPRALLCANVFRTGSLFDEAAFEELLDLADTAGDKVSPAIAMAGRVLTLSFGNHPDLSRATAELVHRLEAIPDTTLEIALLPAAIVGTIGDGEVSEVMRLAQRLIDLADGDPRAGAVVLESPLGIALMFRAIALMCLGDRAWKPELAAGDAMVRQYAPIGHADMAFWNYVFPAHTGAVRMDTATVRDTAEILEVAEQRGDDLAVWSARFVHGFVLAQQPEPDRTRGLELLAPVRDAIVQQRAIIFFRPLIDIEFARQSALLGHIDDAVASLEGILRHADIPVVCFGSYGRVIEVLVELLLQRGGPSDIAAAQQAIDRLAAYRTGPGVVINEIVVLRLRALVARACGEEATYRQYRDRYRALAYRIGFEEHMAMADAMPD
jgi:adenylate cyclase